MTRRFVGVLTASAQLAPAVQNCSLLPGWRLATLDPPQFAFSSVGDANGTILLSTNNKTPQMSMLPEDACDMSRKKISGSRKRLWMAHNDSYTFRTENCWAPPPFKWFKIPDNYTGPEPNFVALLDDNFWKSGAGSNLFPAGRKKLAEKEALFEVSTSCPNWRDICGSDSPPDLPSEYKNCTLPSGYRWLRATDPRKRTSEWFAAPNGGGICRSRTLLEAGALMDLFPSTVDLRKPQNSSAVTSSDTDTEGQLPSRNHDFTFRTPQQFCGVGPVWEVNHLEPPPCKEPEGYVYERIGYKEPRWVASNKENRSIVGAVPRECTRGDAEALDPRREAELSKKALANYELERTRMRNAMRNYDPAHHEIMMNPIPTGPRVVKPRVELSIPESGTAVAGADPDTESEEENSADLLLQMMGSRLNSTLRKINPAEINTSPDNKKRSGFVLLDGEAIRTQAVPPLWHVPKTRDTHFAAPAEDHQAPTSDSRNEATGRSVPARFRASGSRLRSA